MKMQSVRPAAIEAIGYEPTTQRLRITFRQGRTYDYCRVPFTSMSSSCARHRKVASSTPISMAAISANRPNWNGWHGCFLLCTNSGEIVKAIPKL